MQFELSFIIMLCFIHIAIFNTLTTLFGRNLTILFKVRKEVSQSIYNRKEYQKYQFVVHVGNFLIAEDYGF